MEIDLGYRNKDRGIFARKKKERGRGKGGVGGRVEICKVLELRECPTGGRPAKGKRKRNPFRGGAERKEIGTHFNPVESESVQRTGALTGEGGGGGGNTKGEKGVT